MQGRGGWGRGHPERDTGVGPTLTPAQMSLPVRPVPGPGGGLGTFRERDSEARGPCSWCGVGGVRAVWLFSVVKLGVSLTEWSLQHYQSQRSERRPWKSRGKRSLPREERTFSSTHPNPNQIKQVRGGESPGMSQQYSSLHMEGNVGGAD